MAPRLFPAAVAAALALAALAACGTPSADLFVVQRSGTIPGARLTLLVTDGGQVRCNGGPLRDISSDELIEARAIVRGLSGDKDAVGPADRHVDLPPGPGAILRYRVRVEAGDVAFSDTSSGQPPAFFRVAKLTRDLARGPCGLKR
jgi:hypothetical protein